jgi:hypothetical protein
MNSTSDTDCDGDTVNHKRSGVSSDRLTDLGFKIGTK